MTTHDLTILTNYLHGLYGDRFPGLTAGMAQLWYDTLHGADADLVRRPAKRWARHHTLKAPTLDELAEQVEWLEEQDHKARLPVSSADRKTALDLLKDLQEAAPPKSSDDARFGRCMLRLGEHLM